MTKHPRFSGPGARIVRRWSLFIVAFVQPLLIPAVVGLEIALYVHRRRRLAT